MGRHKKTTQPNPLDESEISPESMTDDVFPEGVPKQEDGSVAGPQEITMTRARKIGALNSEAASRNKALARTVQRKVNGEVNVAWDTDNVVDLFESISLAYPMNSISAYVTQLTPQNIEHAPVRCQAFKSGAEFYDQLSRVHGKQGQATYEVRFRDTQNKLYRGTARITMPDTTDQEFTMAGQQPPHGYPPPHGYYPYPYQPPPPQYPYAPAPQPYAPPPQPAQHMNPSVPAQPAPPPPQTAGIQDPALAALMAQLFQRIDAVQGAQQTLQMQTAEAIGMIRGTQTATPAQVQPPPPPIQPAFTMWNPPPGGWPADQAFDRYGNPMRAASAPIGIGAPPSPPPPPPAGQGASAAMGGYDLQGIAQTITGLSKTLDAVKAAVGAGVAGVAYEPDEPEEQAPAVAPPFTTTRLGTSDSSPVLVTRADGSVDAVGTIMGNAPLIPDFLHKTANSLATLQRVQHQRPINAQGVGGPIPQAQRALPAAPTPPAPAPVPPPPPPAPVAAVSFIPSIESLG